MTADILCPAVCHRNVSLPILLGVVSDGILAVPHGEFLAGLRWGARIIKHSKLLGPFRQHRPWIA